MEERKTMTKEVDHKLYFGWHLCQHPIGKAETNRHQKNHT